MLFLLIHLAFSYNVKDAIIDKNINLNRNWTFSPKTNASIYEIKEDGRLIKHKAKPRATYYVDQAPSEKSLYRVEEYAGEQLKSYKYKYGEAGLVESVTVCEKNLASKMRDEKDVLVCQYMDRQVCAKFDKKKMAKKAQDLRACRDLAKELESYFPAMKDKKGRTTAYGRNTESGISQTRKALDLMGIDYGKGLLTNPFNRVPGTDDENYRARNKKVVRQENLQNIDYYYQSFHLAAEICNTIGTASPRSKESAKKARQ